MSNVAGYFRGKPACSCLLKWLPVYEAELKRRGVIKYNLDVYQLIGGASASAGTHSGGGAFDLGQTQPVAIAVARAMGADATWVRRKSQGFDDDHLHGVLRGCPHNGPARYQIAAVDAGFNGLGAGGRGGRDDGPARYRRTWKQGIAWAKTQQPKPKTTRIASWNVYLIKRHPKLSVAYRTSKITAYVKKWDLDVLAVQECPSSRDGAALFPKLAAIGLTKRVGSHGRYLFFRAGTRVHEVKSWEIDGKFAVLACATVNGRRRVFVNCHPVSGSTKAAKDARTDWAEKLIPLVHRFADATNTPREDEIYMGDFNGSEFHTVARKHGIRLVRTFARIKSALTRTYNAWGRKHTTPGGHFDYILTDESKKNAVTKAKTFFTPKASDHNPVFVEIKE